VAQDSEQSSSINFTALWNAVQLVAEKTHIAGAKDLLERGLAGNRIRYRYQEIVTRHLDPPSNLPPLSGVESKDDEVRQHFSLFDTYCSGATVDYQWEGNSIHRIGPSIYHPLPMLGRPRRLDQRVSGLTVCIEDVEAEMRSIGLLPPLAPPSVEANELADADSADQLPHPKFEPSDEPPEPEQPESELEREPGLKLRLTIEGMRQLYPPSGITTKTHKEVATELATIKVKVSPSTVRRARPLLKPAQPPCSSLLKPAQEPEQG
jgi:hypothetical protein